MCNGGTAASLEVLAERSPCGVARRSSGWDGLTGFLVRGVAGDDFSLALAGDLVRTVPCGGIGFGGESGMVGFRIDLYCTAIVDYFEDYSQLQIDEPGAAVPTFCRLPESSRKASRPPGPMLLLRLFLPPALIGEASPGLRTASLLRLSLLLAISDSGRWAIDLRERDRDIAPVRSPIPSILRLKTTPGQGG